MELTDRQRELCTTSAWDFTDLRALYVNCTLKPSPSVSHTQGLMDVSIAIMEANGVTVDRFRAADHEIRPASIRTCASTGLGTTSGRSSTSGCSGRTSSSSARRSGWARSRRLRTRLIERLYGNSSQLNEEGQYAYYGKVGGCLVTGNEDGVKHCAMNVLYSLQHLGYVIPPQADAGWIGEAGPGPSYLDPGSGRAGERLHQPQHDVHDLEPPARGAAAQGRGRLPGARKPAGARGTQAAASTSTTRIATR